MLTTIKGNVGVIHHCPFIVSLLTIVLSVLRFTDSDYLIGIFKFFSSSGICDFSRSWLCILFKKH